ncbi:MAG: aspartate-semialdehyde dehydrogenase [Planctomycetota bacterium]
MYDTVTIVGATGAVGRIIVQLLEERNFPRENFRFLASARTAGSKITFRGKEYTVEEVGPESFRAGELVIASTPDEVAAELLPHALKAGSRVIDESAHFRMDPTAALVIPEVNPDAALACEGILAGPNCSVIPLVMTLKALEAESEVERVVVSTYQAVSGAGLQGSADLEAGTRAALAGESYDYEAFTSPIAFNAIPQIGSFKDDGYTSEELKTVNETRKILCDDAMRLSATCVRVPVGNCHSESITVETAEPIAPTRAKELFAAFPGVTVVDDTTKGSEKYPMPLDCSGKDDVFVGRVRKDLSHDRGLSYWCVSDNLRKGAATNAVQIAELLVKNG